MTSKTFCNATLCACSLAIGTAAAGCGVDAQHPGAPGEPAAGGSIEIASGQAGPNAVVVSGEHVYWASYGDGTYGSGAVMRARKEGGLAVAIAEGQDFPRTLAVDDSGVTWATYGPVGGGSLLRAPLEGGATFALASGIDLAAGVAVFDGRAFWTEMLGDKVVSVGLDGAGERMVAEGQDGAGPLAIAGGAVFWGAGPALLRDDGIGGPVAVWSGAPVSAIAPIRGGVVWITRGADVLRTDGRHAELLAAGRGDADAVGMPGVAADADHAYFTSPADGTVNRVALLGGEAEVLVSGQTMPGAVAVDHDHVYWVDSTRGLVLKAKKANAR